MQFLDKQGLGTFLAQLKKKFFIPDKNDNSRLRPSLEVLNKNMDIRRQYLLEIDYENTLAFNTSFIVGDNNPYVGYAVVGSTYVA